MYKALFLSPMIPSFDLDETGRFFVDILEFVPTYRSAEYAIFEKDGLTVHLLPAGQDIGQMELYLEVDNVDALWESIKDRVGHLKTKAPFDREYKMREAHIGIPQTNALLFLGQCI